MNNLTTRKIVLGMLMALVLVFSVQGIAEAQITVTRSSGDLQVVDVEDTYTIRFRVSDVTFTDGVPDGSVALGSDVTEINGVDTTETTLQGAEGANRLRNATYSVTYQAPDTGVVETKAIQGTVFTIYVVNDAATTPATEVEIQGGNTVRGNQDSLINISVTGGFHLPATITVNGGGRVYVRAASGQQTSATSSLSTSSDAPVYLRMSSRTNKVTVTIPGLGSDTTTFIYGNPSLEKISGTEQSGNQRWKARGTAWC